MQFNLIEQPWIPIDKQLLSINELFDQAHTIQKVSHANPLVIASIYRLLTAILYRVYQPDELDIWLKLYDSGRFDKKLEDYLSQWLSSFDLFSKEKPFFQIPGFKKDKKNSIKKLSPHWATANNKTLFSHHCDNEEFSLTPSESAQMLLVAQYFALGGGISGSSAQFDKHPNYANAPLVGGAIPIVHGSNLFETLMYFLHPELYERYNKNIRLANLNDTEDKPIWEQLKPTQQNAFQRSCSGLSDYLTWPSRYIRLLPNDKGQVSEVYIAQGAILPRDRDEPFFCHKQTAKGDKYPVNLRFGRSLWRDSSALLHKVSIKNKPEPVDWSSWNIQLARFLYDEGESDKFLSAKLSCEVVGLENNKANPINWYSETLSFSAGMLAESTKKNEEGKTLGDILKQSIRYAEKKSSDLNSAVRYFSELYYKNLNSKDEISRLTNMINITQYYWPQLDSKFQSFVRVLMDNNEVNEEVNTAYKHWLKVCRMVARESFEYRLKGYLGLTYRPLYAYVMAKQKLEEGLIGEKYSQSESHSMTVESYKHYIDHIKTYDPENNYVDREAFAKLRRALSSEPGAWLEALPWISDFLPRCQQEQKVYAWLAGLYATHPDYYDSGYNLGRSLRLLKADKKGSLDLRLQTLVDTELRDILPLLRSFIIQLKNNGIGIDYALLLHDLLRWDDKEKPVQARWLYDFYRNITEKKKETTV